jgi:hypothetical protein
LLTERDPFRTIVSDTSFDAGGKRLLQTDHFGKYMLVEVRRDAAS